MFVSASIDPFAPEGAVYRRPIDSDGPLKPLGGGVPRWMDGIVDTNGIAARGSWVAIIGRGGCVYLSDDDGETWSRGVEGLPVPSGLHIC